MRYDIDLFAGYSYDHRWDKYPNAKLLNIIFLGSTFGNFLKFFLDKYSKLSGNISGDPFTITGTSHNYKQANFSGLIQRYHASFVNDNKGENDLPVCLIMPSTDKHYLYLKKAQWFRGGDRRVSPDDLWKKSVGGTSPVLADSVKEITDLYDIKETTHYPLIPKFIVRDWYKMGFLMYREETYNYQLFNKLKSHEFFKSQKVFHLDLEAFFNWHTFLENITAMDDFFGLSLDFDRKDEMKQFFDRGIQLDEIRQECNLVESVVNDNTDCHLNCLDVSSEGFIYAEMEKRHDFIQMPLTNGFFKDTAEMRQFIEFYPKHYKVMNPNMPKFNGIDNPFYLYKKK